MMDRWAGNRPAVRQRLPSNDEGTVRPTVRLPATRSQGEGPALSYRVRLPGRIRAADPTARSFRLD